MNNNDIILNLNDKDFIALHIFSSIINNKKFTINWFYNSIANKYIPSNIEDSSNYHKQFDEAIENWKNIIKPGSTVIDIGCYSLDTTLPMAFLAGDLGKVIGFDPNPLTFKWALLNKNINPSLNIDLYNYAIMENDGEFEFRYDNDLNNGGPSLYTSIIGNYPKIQKFKGINLKNFLLSKNEKIDNISFIKSDTEGYDCRVLLSLKEIIDNNKPIIQIEWFPCIENEIIEIFRIINYRPVNPINLKPLEIKPENRIQDIILLPNI